MKRKLWIAYCVMGATTVFIGLVGDSYPITLGTAVVAAAFGWAAFFMEE